MNDPHVRVGVGVFVLSPRGYPLLLRKGSHGAGEWSLPGGHLEFNETVVECSQREVLEELGVNITNIKTLPFFSEDRFPNDGKHYITLYTVGITTDHPAILEPDKASDLLYVNITDVLPQPLFVGTAAAWTVLKLTNINQTLP